MLWKALVAVSVVSVLVGTVAIIAGYSWPGLACAVLGFVGIYLAAWRAR